MRRLGSGGKVTGVLYGLRVTLNSLEDLEDVIVEGVFHGCEALPFLILGKSNR